MLEVGLRLRRGDEYLAYLQRYAPSFANPDAATVPLHVRIAEAKSVPELAQLLPHEVMLSLLDDIDEFYDAIGGARTVDAHYYIDSLIVRGDVEAAIETYLSDISSRPPSRRRFEAWRLSSPFKSELAADPRIQASLEQAQQEIAILRDNVREYLATQQDMSF
jgi:hypothetical protein